MRIVDHKLVRENGKPIPFVPSPNAGGTLMPEYLVMHYTAAGNAAGSIVWFQTPAAKASAHLVIDRDGSITQMVPFNRIAWHAGESKWRNRVGMNQWSIGIELANAGRLERHGKDWKASYGALMPPDRVVEATHKHDSAPAGWEIYSPAQLDAAAEVAQLLIKTYKLKDVIGHDDIAPNRKSDPGPAFPMESFRAAAVGS